MALGVELGYVEITTNFTSTSTSLVDVTGLSLTVNVGARPILIIVYAQSFQTPGTFGSQLNLQEDGTDLGSIIGSTTTAFIPVFGAYRRAPTAGPHTYKVRGKTTTAGTWQVTAGTGASSSVNNPAFLQVIEI